MHPQLIPEKHPKCGKIMEALVRCREANPVGRYWGVCNEHTFDLTKCLAEEKKEFRAPRQAKFHERWAAKREADAKRLAELEEQAAAQRAAESASSSTGRPEEATSPAAAAHSPAEPPATAGGRAPRVGAGSHDQAPPDAKTRPGA